MKKALTLATVFLAGMAVAQHDLTHYPVDELDKTPPAELKARREKIKQALGPGSIGVFFTTPTRNRNNDVDFQFRGDSNFLYLTGFEEPDSVLILAPDGILANGRMTTEVIFVNEANQMSITWLGYRMGSANVPRLLGIETAMPNTSFASVLDGAIKSGVKVSTSRMPDGPVDTLKQMMDAFAARMDVVKPQAGANIQRTLTAMRGIKSPWEIELMKKVCEISARAHIEAMKAMKPDIREYEIASLVGYHYGKNGCEYVGYPSICGSGPNSTILHYNTNRRLMKSGEVFLIDSAGEYHNYTSDITRSYPVNGKFTPEQRAIYEIVYAGQEVGINLCKSGSTMGQIENGIRAEMAARMIKLGIISKPDELGMYYMHGFGHGLGLDVHDPVPNTLAPGAILTVEPGIYIKEGSPCDKKWWNIGIRIEDDILVTEKGPVNLSIAAPRTWQEVEKTMAAR
jgi:Xaa-Pro aminopeptidase